MKIYINIIIIISFLLIGSPLVAQDDVKIGVVDIKLVFENYSVIKKAKLELNKKKENYLSEIKRIEDDINALENELKNKKKQLTPKDYRIALAKIELKKIKLNELIDKRNLELKKIEERIRKPVLKKILFIVEQIRKEKGYTVILNKNDVLAYHDKIDLTKEVLERLESEK